MPARRAGYLFNTTIAGIEQADAILLVGTNPRREAPVLNARIRKRWLQRRLARSAAIGAAGRPDLSGRAARRRRRRRCSDARRRQARLRRDAAATRRTPMIIVGQGALARADGAARAGAAGVAERCGTVRDRTGTASTCCTRAAARVGGLDLGFVPGAGRPRRRRHPRRLRRRRDRCCLSARRRRDRHRAASATAFVDLPGPSRRSPARTAPT